MILLLPMMATAGCAISEGDRAPDWTLADIADQAHSLHDYHGKIVVLDFWATWCPPCLPVSPHMQALHEKYRDDGVLVIGIHYNDEGNPTAYIKEHGYDFLNMVDGFEVAQRYGVSKIPTIMIVSAEGTVVHRQTGFGEGDQRKLEAVIERLLARAPSSR
jgi:thiol-disulfide isomerase/thioredoxin